MSRQSCGDSPSPFTRAVIASGSTRAPASCSARTHTCGRQLYGEAWRARMGATMGERGDRGEVRTKFISNSLARPA